MPKILNAVELLSQFMSSLSEAAGTAHVMCHMFQDPRFLAVRDLLEAVRNECVEVAVTPVAL